MSLEHTDILQGVEPDRRWQSARNERRVEAVRRTVLVVEDDAEHRELLAEMLSSWGYRPLPVASAEEAEHTARRARIEAAIVDVFLPGRSGVALVARLRERFPEAVLIGISALGSPALARQLKGLGANLFIPKPIGPEHLAQALRSKPHSWH
jgi:DNA-binding response OmpR family regulator